MHVRMNVPRVDSVLGDLSGKVEYHSADNISKAWSNAGSKNTTGRENRWKSVTDKVP